MNSYQIIDEPKPSAYEYLIVDPVVILFASILVPLFIDLPFYSRFWGPFAWGILNAFLLGSPTKKKEIFIAIVGVLFLASLFIGMGVLGHSNIELMNSLMPYFHIIIQAILFFALYLIIFYQTVPYSIHKYIKEQNGNDL